MLRAIRKLLKSMLGPSCHVTRVGSAVVLAGRASLGEIAMLSGPSFNTHCAEPFHTVPCASGSSMRSSLACSIACVSQCAGAWVMTASANPKPAPIQAQRMLVREEVMGLRCMCGLSLTRRWATVGQVQHKASVPHDGI